MARTCPHCGFVEESTRERCSRCGRSVLVRGPRLTGARRRWVIWGGGTVGLIALAVVVAIVLHAKSERDARQQAADARAVAAERVRLKRLQAPHRGAARDLRPPPDAGRAELVAARAALVRRVEASITRDARARARTGEIAGNGGATVGSIGYPFVAALDFRRFTYVWCRNTPAQSERGKALAFVRLDRACLAAKGRALGTGYVDVPGS